MQLEAIERADAAGAALVADVKAKILDASPVDHLWIVKARSSRRAPLAVRGCPSVSLSAPHAGVLAYPWYALLSTPQHAGVLLAYVPACSMASYSAPPCPAGCCSRYRGVP